MTSIQTSVCVGGRGPASLLLGLLLAKRGVDVLVLEGHETFRREFRSEVPPSLPKSPVPRPSPQATPEELPSPMPRRLSRPRTTWLQAAPAWPPAGALRERGHGDGA